VPSLRQLDYLVAIADTLHFRRAAEKVNTTQSTLSTQIKALEDRLGILLIERSRSQVMLTSAGQDVVEVARRMLKDAQDIRDLARGYRLGPTGLLRVGVTCIAAPMLVPRLSALLRAHFPSLSVAISEGLPGALMSELEDGRLELAIVAMPEKSDALGAATLFDDQLLLVVRSSDSLADRKSVSLGDLQNRDVLVLGPGHRVHDDIGELLTAASAQALSSYGATSIDTLCELVARGAGATLVPAHAMRERLMHDKRLATVPVIDNLKPRSFALMWRIAAQNAPDIAKARQAIKAEFSKDVVTRV
jgi:LysR family transcriptional regulator, hydrogen peroxide-inducible genes activator